MTAPRPAVPGATRNCPHCQEVILESAAVCPACKHHLRFEKPAAAPYEKSAAVPGTETHTSLRVEGSIRNPPDGQIYEYSMVLTIRNERGEEIARRLVGVGAMQPEERRTFTLTVEMTGAGKPDPKRGTRH
jgi:hypothetical protein